MFIKETFDQRIRNQEGTNQRMLKNNKVPVMGSIRNQKINYDRQQQFFSKQDVPPKALFIKETVKNFIDPDHLGLRKKQWNTSVSVPKKLQADETHEQRLLKIKLGFMDHPIPKYTGNKIYEGTQIRDDYTNWNVSNQVSKKQIKQNLQKTTMSAFQNTKIKQKQYLEEYLDPLHKTTNHITKFKKDWQSKQDLRKQIKNKYIFDNPTASQEKTNAAVFRLTYETGVKGKKDDIEAIGMKTDFRATLSETQKSKISVQFRHSGVWQAFPEKVGDQIEQTWAWSCCMNEELKSRGCVNKIKDKNKWNLSSFNA